MNDAIRARLARLRQAFGAAGIDGLLVSQPQNRSYLSGFSGSTGWLLISNDVALIAADSRYWEQIGEECPEFELVKFGEGGRSFTQDGLPALVQRAGVRRLGFEADAVTFADAQAWLEQPFALEWVATRGLVLGLRAVKDAGEIELLRTAVALADEALAWGIAQAHPGMTERDLAWMIESYMRTHGAEEVAFEVIVGAGKNGAQPHHRAADVPLLPGQPIVIDMGARLHGYCSDLTRTICLGKPAEADLFWTVYDTVLRAQAAAEAAVRPGIACQEVDSVARDMIGVAGYGPNFGHGLGHGVGLAIHEEPALRQGNGAPLVAGQVVTVEPGVYLPDWGGVRIEDIVLVTEDGAEVLTRAPKQPVV